MLPMRATGRLSHQLNADAKRGVLGVQETTDSDIATKVSQLDPRRSDSER